MLEFFIQQPAKPLLMAALLLLSAGFSGSETALFSLRPHELLACRKRGGWRDRCLLRLREDSADVLYTILLGNLVVNIVYFSVAAGIMMDAQKKLGAAAAAGISAAALAVLVIGGEVMPKSIGAVLPLTLGRLTAPAMLGLHRLLSPLCFCLKKATEYFLRALRLSKPETDARENLRLLFEHYRNEGAVTADEYDFLSTINDLHNIRVREIMTPRVDAVAVDADADIADLLALARQSRHSKIPVRESGLDQFLGWVDDREFFFSETDLPLRARLKPLFYLSEFSTAEKALKCFLEQDAVMAVVVDEHGADVGILVLTDIMAEIFGEFGEGGTPAVEPVRQESENVYLLDGGLSVRELQNLVGTAVRLPGVASVGGLVTAMLGRTAKIGDRVTLGEFILTVTETARRRPTVLKLAVAEKTLSD